MVERKIVITCEHAVNDIPAEFASLFEGRRQLLESHRGYDRGALAVAKLFGGILSAPVFQGTVSRLLIDCNRSLHHHELFSTVSKKLDDSQKNKVIARYYLPFRIPVERRIARLVDKGASVLHLSVHSFTPVLNGKARNCDIGLLYDPSRASEKAFCDALAVTLKEGFPGVRIRCNFPYRGVSDGFATHMRKRFAYTVYRGIEIEINQGLESTHTWEWIGETFGMRIHEILSSI